MSELDRLLALERIQGILELLTPGQLVVLALVLDGMSYREIGQALGISKQAARARLDSASRKLAREMPEVARRRGGDEDTWAARELAFLRAVDELEVATLPAVAEVAGFRKNMCWQVWDRVRVKGWVVNGRNRGKSRPVELTDAGRERLEGS